MCVRACWGERGGGVHKMYMCVCACAYECTLSTFVYMLQLSYCFIVALSDCVLSLKYASSYFSDIVVWMTKVFDL